MDIPKLGRLLVVDDEIELMTILCEALEKHGYETEGFTSGPEALQRAKKDGFDLLLTDLMMPEMNGIELLKAVLAIDPGLIGIVMTGQGTVQTAVEAMKIGAFDYILKPFKIDILLLTISRAMEVRNLKKENIELRGMLAIYELTKAVALSTDLSLVVNKVADAALEQTFADEVSIMLPAGDDDELYVAAVRGRGREHILGQRVKLGQGIAGWVARHHEMLTLEGAVNDARFKPFHPRPEINAAVSIPMMAGGKFVGILNLNSINRRSFTIGQIKALAITLSMAAPSIQNAGLFQMLREAETKYRGLFENAVEGVFQIDPASGRFITVNPSLAGILGYDSTEELMGHVTDIKHQLYVDPDQYALQRKDLEENNEVVGFEARMYRKDGKIIWISLNIRAIRAYDGELLHYEGSVEDITTRKKAEEELKSALERLRRSLLSIIRVISTTVEARDPYTAGHQDRVAAVACAIAQEMGLPEETVDNIGMAGNVHDIGKMSVPAEILAKPTMLSSLEMSLIKIHPRSGYDILKDVELPYPVAEIVLQHHERLDGTGYPQGLKNGDILLEAKIISVADVVEAIASHRPYRPAKGIDVALEEIERNKGILYDAAAVDACLRLFREKEFKFK